MSTGRLADRLFWPLLTLAALAQAAGLALVIAEFPVLDAAHTAVFNLAAYAVLALTNILGVATLRASSGWPTGPRCGGDRQSTHPCADLHRRIDTTSAVLTGTPFGGWSLNGGGSPGRVIGAVGSISSGGRGQRSRARAAPTGPARTEAGESAHPHRAHRGREAHPGPRPDLPADTAEGLRHVEQGHARGKVVITVA